MAFMGTFDMAFMGLFMAFMGLFMASTWLFMALNFVGLFMAFMGIFMAFGALPPCNGVTVVDFKELGALPPLGLMALAAFMGALGAFIAAAAILALGASSEDRAPGAHWSR